MRTAYWGKKSYRKCFQQETAMSCQFNIQHGTFCKKRRKLCFVILIHFTMNLDWDKLVIFVWRQMSNFSATSYIFDEMMMTSALYLTTTLIGSWIYIMLDHWSNILWVASLGHIIGSCCLIMLAKLRSSKYQFYSIWF